MALNKAQKAVLTAYENGEYSELITLDDVDECGDGLIAFLVHEVSDLDEGETENFPDEVRRRIQVAIDQLMDVQNAFEDAWNNIETTEDGSEAE